MLISIRSSDLCGEEVEYFATHWERHWTGSKSTSEGGNETIAAIDQFLVDAKERLDGRLFIAKNTSTNTIVGSISCQEWRGPVPIEVVSDCIKFGAIWGPSSGDRFIDEKLIRTATDYLRGIGCQKVLMADNGSSDLRPFQDCGFTRQNLLSMELTAEACVPTELTILDGQHVQIRAGGPEYDSIVSLHWEKMWNDVGIDKVADNNDEITHGFIDDARKRLRYQTFVAITDEDVVIGSLGCQVLSGSFPLPADCQPYGTVWAVYVQPKYRRNGIATALMQHAMHYLHDSGNGCSHAVLIAASAEGQRVYERLGFSAQHCLVRDFTEDRQVTMDQLLEKHGVSPSDFGPRVLQALETATARQLLAAFGDDPTRLKGIQSAVKEMQQRIGCYIDPDDNWLTSNVVRFGRGFDATRLQRDRSELVRKFDRLAQYYDHWTVGNRSKVEIFVAHCATTRLLARTNTAIARTAARVLDVAAGIGLQGQMLRLLGFEGYLVGTDVSPGMVDIIKSRNAYDTVLVADATANDDDGLQHQLMTLLSDDELCNTTTASANDVLTPSNLIDVVICTGAMELFADQVSVLRRFASLLADDGELWVSFQLESAATQHQRVVAVTEERAVQCLRHAGFHVVATQVCPDAFYTPSPAQDGSMMPVPYLFVVANKNEEVAGTAMR